MTLIIFLSSVPFSYTLKTLFDSLFSFEYELNTIQTNYIPYNSEIQKITCSLNFHKSIWTAPINNININVFYSKSKNSETRKC